MKLQLLAEDISLALEEQSLAGLQRIPRAVAEIDRVEHDTKGLQTRIQGILRRLDDAEGASRESVRLLTSVDEVKGRMESARETLRNAAGLAELVASVDDVFAAGNIRHMADVLSSMRRGLKVVGGVPEFQDAPEKLEELERRIEALRSTRARRRARRRRRRSRRGDARRPQSLRARLRPRVRVRRDPRDDPALARVEHLRRRGARIRRTSSREREFVLRLGGGAIRGVASELRDLCRGASRARGDVGVHHVPGRGWRTRVHGVATTE